MSKQAAKPVLEHDIADLSPFGGSVAAVLRQGLVKDDAQEALIEYLLEGTKPGPEAETMIQERDADWNLSFIHEPRLILAALLALPDEAVSRAAPVVGLTIPPTLREVSRLSRGLAGPTYPTTIEDFLVCGQRWGWGEEDVVAAVADGSIGIDHLAALSATSLSVVTQAAELLSPGGGGNRHRDLLWRSLSNVTGDDLVVFAPMLLADSGSGDEALRFFARPLVRSLPQGVSVDGLRSLINTGSALVRQRAATTLLSVLTEASDPVPGMLGWVEDQQKNERSVRVRTVLDQIHTMVNHQEITAISLPTVEFDDFEITKEDGARYLSNCATAFTLKDLERYLRGSNTIQDHDSYQVLRSIADEETSLDLRNRMGPANCIRRMLHWVASWHSTTSDRLVATGFGDSVDPLFITAVGHRCFPERRPGGVYTGTILLLVCRLWRANPERWTHVAIAEWLNFQATEVANAIDDPILFLTDRDGLIEMALSVQDCPDLVRDAALRAALKGPEKDRRRYWGAVDERYTNDVLKYLTKGRSERLSATEWIAAHPSQVATDALLTAARVEKDDLVRAAMLGPLEAAGVDLEEFLSPEVLLATAIKAMKKKSSLSKAIAWLDIKALPQLHWADGTQVEDTVVSWTLHSAAKNKTAAPSAIVRRHFSNMDTDDVQAFGSALFQTWVEYDLALVSPSDARAEAQRLATRSVSAAQRWPQRYPQYVGLTEQQIAELHLPECAAAYRGSGRTSQGLLAVVAAAGSPAVTERARSYIRTYRTKHASQSKALIEMLTWMDDPGAVQTVMAMANRFHPKSLQQQAALQVELLAQHRNWSINDLADRSVPDGGFDHDGRLTFDFGSRTFSAHLGDDLGIALFDDATGKSIRSLPRGRADEDRDNIKALKTVLKDAKSDAAAALDFQPHRLRRAMATQRTWSAADFQWFVIEQPLMIRLASRLLWITNDADGSEVIFRPLTDGTILTMDDNELELVDRPVHLAHGALLSNDMERNAADHLRDYEVDVLFPQLFRTAITVAKGQRSLDVVTGSTLSANRLAAHARSRGWQVVDTNGTGSSVGVFVQFPDLGLKAILAVEGGLHLGGYDYIDYDCTLSNLYVVKLEALDHCEQAAIGLDALPLVLLSELACDALDIAESGDPSTSGKVP